MTPIEIVTLLRLGISAAVSIGIDIKRVNDMLEENGGELTDEDLQTLLNESQAAIDEL